MVLFVSVFVAIKDAVYTHKSHRLSEKQSVLIQGFTADYGTPYETKSEVK